MTGPVLADQSSSTLLERVDGFLRERPAAMLAATIGAAVLATMALLAQPQGAIVLYQAF